MSRTAIPAIIFLVICILCTAVAFAISEPSMRILLGSRDFRNHYAGAVQITGPMRRELYQVKTQYDTQRAFIPEMWGERGLMPYIRPPVVAAVLSPLAQTSFMTAYRIFTVMNLVVLIVLVALFTRAFATSIIPLIFAVYLPIWIALLQGQFSYLLLLVFFGVWYFSRKNDYKNAGFVLSGLIIFPQLIIVPSLFFVLTKRYKIVLWSLIPFALFAFMSIALIGLRGVLEYPSFLMFLSNAGEAYTMHPRIQTTIRSMLHFLFGTDYVNGGILVGWIGSSVALLIFMLRRYYLNHTEKKISRAQYDTYFSLMVLLTLLSSAHTNYHDLSLLLLPFILLLRPFRLNNRRTYLLIAGILIFGLVAYWFPFLAPPLLIALYVYLLRPDFFSRKRYLTRR